MQGIRFQENVIELFYFDLVLKSKKYLINHNQKVSHFRCSIFRSKLPGQDKAKENIEVWEFAFTKDDSMLKYL